jgi:FAD/FMN-containing dehydrogenase
VLQIVLANGSISNISQSTHPDLYWALRGGGKNFGIVTRFDLETVPQKQMYGGLNIFLLSDARNRFSRLKIVRNFSWTKSWFFEKAADWANQMACLVGYCITFDNFTKLVAWNSIEVLSDLDAQLYGWMVLLPYTHTYIVGTQVNHGVAASNASAYEPLRKLKHVFTTNRVSKYTDFIQEITENNDRGNR